MPELPNEVSRVYVDFPGTTAAVEPILVDSVARMCR